VKNDIGEYIIFKGDNALAQLPDVVVGEKNNP